MIEKIKECISKAMVNDSKLTQEELNIDGMTGNKVRHLLNNLAGISRNILEIGTHKGAMTVACNFRNNNITAYAVCDNWSQFHGDGGSRNEFFNNMEKYDIGCEIFEQDCFTIDLKRMPKIDMYIFDGDHDYESQKKALTYFKPIFADEFILVVDDFSWVSAREGTQDGIYRNNMTILYQKQLGVGTEGDKENWWNGIFVGLIKK